jgi:adenylate kinase
VRVVILGPPGAGKGTQAKCLEKKYRIPHISTGEILRQAISNGSHLGKEAARYIHRGCLVPDPLILDIVHQRLLKPDCAPGYILDGFPRTLGQVRRFDALLEEMEQPLDAVISLEVRLEMFVKRLSARRVCPNCGTVYNLLTTPPRSEGVCDACGGGLAQRPDDVEETIQKRFEIYRRETFDIKNFYITRGLLREVDGEGTVEEVHRRIVGYLKGV